jgi:NADH dehydrogenase
MEKKNVVILGAGFGGLRAAMDIAKKLKHLNLLDKYEVTLIDRNDCHIFIPLLYKVAASPMPEYENTCSYDISTLLKNFPINFLQGEITSPDVTSGKITLKDGRVIMADYLVIALGSETNYFGIPGLKENALQLKTLESALQVRAAVAATFGKGGNVRIITGGGGPNGLELAGELRLWADTAEKEHNNLHVTVSIVEAMPTILPGFDENIIKLAMARLKRLGIPVMTGMKISSVTANAIMTGDPATPQAPIPFDILVWTGGTKTPDLLTPTPVKKEPRGKPMAGHGMELSPGTPELKLAPMVYAVGDNVFFMNAKTQKPVPAVAHAAISEGTIAAHNVVEEIKSAEKPGHYLPKPQIYSPDGLTYSYVIPIGEPWGVAKLGPIIISGWLGWEASRFIELNYLMTIMPLGRALKAWRRM